MPRGEIAAARAGSAGLFKLNVKSMGHSFESEQLDVSRMHSLDGRCLIVSMLHISRHTSA